MGTTLAKITASVVAVDDVELIDARDSGRDAPAIPLSQSTLWKDPEAQSYEREETSCGTESGSAPSCTWSY